MRTQKSVEAEEELNQLKRLDRETGIALEACSEMLIVDANEFEGHEGFSIKRVGGLFKRGVRVSRVKYEKYIHGRRILFFSIPTRNCVFVTGIHARGDLGVGNDYDFAKEPFTRAARYWGMRNTLC
ncbi:MAG: hypothetical protein WEB59_16115 [Thermoanaerobaculia bacterium]